MSKSFVLLCLQLLDLHMAYDVYSMNIYEQMRKKIPAPLGLTVSTLDFLLKKQTLCSQLHLQHLKELLIPNGCSVKKKLLAK